MIRIDLSGKWALRLDEQMRGLSRHFESYAYPLEIDLPGTVAAAEVAPRDIEYSNAPGAPGMTASHPFAGYAWYQKSVNLPFDHIREIGGRKVILHIERARRILGVWVDNQPVGSSSGDFTTAEFDLTPFLHTICPSVTVMVSNAPSEDNDLSAVPETVTAEYNWNGMLGEIYIKITSDIYIKKSRVISYPTESNAELLLNIACSSEFSELVLKSHVDLCRLLPDEKERTDADEAETPSEDERKSDTSSDDQENTELSGPQFHDSRKSIESNLKIWNDIIPVIEYEAELNNASLDSSGSYISTVRIPIDLSKTSVTWDEYEPWVYRLTTEIYDGEEVIDNVCHWFGFRDFKAFENHFELNGSPFFIRGEYDPLSFPLTGFAPVSLGEWLTYYKCTKNWGINCIRYYKYIPSEAALLAADFLGLCIFLTIEDYSSDQLEVLRSLTSHPSLLLVHRDSCRIASRLSRTRLLRGAFPECDGPLGFIQNSVPGTSTRYDATIRPDLFGKSGFLLHDSAATDETISTLADSDSIPLIPVISDRIGGYDFYPDPRYLTRDQGSAANYTGLLKPSYITSTLRKVLSSPSGPYLSQSFECAGALAANCLKNELEAAFRSEYLAGFFLSGLRDNLGVHPSLSGVLDPLSKNKGFFSETKWRTFCSDTVLMACFPSYIVEAGSSMKCRMLLAYYGKEPIASPVLSYCMIDRRSGETISSGQCDLPDIDAPGRHKLCICKLKVPESEVPMSIKLVFELSSGTVNTRNTYYISSFPKMSDIPEGELAVSEKTGEIEPEFFTSTGTRPYSSRLFKVSLAKNAGEALEFAKTPGAVLLYANDLPYTKSVKVSYAPEVGPARDLNSYSAAKGKPGGPGTYGLVINSSHPAISDFMSDACTTPEWYRIVSGSRAVILDGAGISPIVRVIDSPSRNHLLGMIFEVSVDDLPARILVCTADLPSLIKENCAEALFLQRSMFSYLVSTVNRFRQLEVQTVTSEAFLNLFT